MNFRDIDCGSVAESLIAENGEASQTYDFYEETVPSKRFIWKSEGETMMLQCHKNEGQFWAEAVSFIKT